MLAYNGLALITEKLQAQRLEEATTAGNTATTSNITASGPGTSACSFTSSKLPQVSPESGIRPTGQSHLTVKGKNVWALSLESERSVRGFELTSGPIDSVKTRSQTLHHQLSLCRHRKPRHSCPSCSDSNSYHAQANLAPPKKKHCRSLSVPPPTDATVPSSNSHAKIWRPIAVIPLNSNPNNTPSDSSGLQHINNNNSLIAAGSQSNNGVFNNSCISSLDDSNTASSPQHPLPTYSPLSPHNNYKWLPKLNPSTSFMHPLRSSSSVPSPPSIDSGHFTTSDFTTSDFTASDLATPPGSPVPRPASAISSSDVSSFSSLSSPWHDSCSSRSQRVRVLENRSLSMEDRISGPAPSLSHASSFHSASCIDPSQHRSNISSSGCLGESSCGGTIPRCHSQPCVLHSRRYGKKRRRDCDNIRPTLNFNKMTETAYTRSHRRSEPWSTVAPPLQRVLGQPELHDTLTSDLSGSRAAFCLNPIASSPLDPPSIDMAADVALPLTPPEQLSPALPPSQWGDGEDSLDCGCHDLKIEETGLFPITDLDLDQIENH